MSLRLRTTSSTAAAATTSTVAVPAGNDPVVIAGPAMAGATATAMPPVTCSTWNLGGDNDSGGEADVGQPLGEIVGDTPADVPFRAVQPPPHAEVASCFCSLCQSREEDHICDPRKAAQTLLYGVERMVRKAWTDCAGWLGLASARKEDVAAAVEYLRNAIEQPASTTAAPPRQRKVRYAADATADGAWADGIYRVTIDPGHIVTSDRARALGFVPEVTGVWTDRWVQANMFQVRGVFARGDAQKFRTADLTDLVRDFLTGRGVELEVAEHPEVFCYNFTPSINFDEAAARARQDSREAAANGGAALGAPAAEQPGADGLTDDLLMVIKTLMGMRAAELGPSAAELIVYMASAERDESHLRVTEESHGDHGRALRLQLQQTLRAPAAQEPGADGLTTRQRYEKQLAAVTPAELAAERTPRVGDDVHYVSRGSADGEYSQECRAAKVTSVAGSGFVTLFVMNPTGTFHNPAQYDGGDPGAEGRLCGHRACRGGTWHWPAA